MHPSNTPTQWQNNPSRYVGFLSKVRQNKCTCKAWVILILFWRNVLVHSRAAWLWISALVHGIVTSECAVLLSSMWGGVHCKNAGIAIFLFLRPQLRGVQIVSLNKRKNTLYELCPAAVATQLWRHVSWFVLWPRCVALGHWIQRRHWTRPRVGKREHDRCNFVINSSFFFLPLCPECKDSFAGCGQVCSVPCQCSLAYSVHWADTSAEPYWYQDIANSLAAFVRLEGEFYRLLSSLQKGMLACVGGVLSRCCPVGRERCGIFMDDVTVY